MIGKCLVQDYSLFFHNIIKEVLCMIFMIVIIIILISIEVTLRNLKKSNDELKKEIIELLKKND